MSPMDYLAANWIWLLLALVIGFILGWLLIGLPAGSRRGKAEQRANELNNELGTTKRKLTDTEKQVQSLQGQLANETSLVASGAEQQAELQARVESGTQEVAELQAKSERLQEALTYKEAELADALAKLAGPVRLFEQVSGISPTSVNLDHLTPLKAPAIINAVIGGIKPRLVSTPQDMVSIQSIGKALEQRLYDAGIGTYWEVANIDSEALIDLLQLSPAQKATVKPDELQKSALELAQKSEMLGAIWNVQRIDDLEIITGISGVFEQRLYDAGITTFQELANCTIEQLSDICRAPTTMMPNYGFWISRAQELVNAHDNAESAQAAS